MGDASLKFGIICKGTTLEAWQASCLKQLMLVTGVEPGLLIVVCPAAREVPGKVLWRALQSRFNRKCRSRQRVNMDTRFADTPHRVQYHHLGPRFSALFR